ncbi:DUF4838 domain-containing protein [Paenibacillus sp. CMAA1364]
MIRNILTKILSISLIFGLLTQIFYMGPQVNADAIPTLLAGDTLTLVSNNKVNSTMIWWSKDSNSTMASFAASELQSYVKKITGATIPVVKGTITQEESAQLGNMSSALVLVTGDEASNYAAGNQPATIPLAWLNSANTKLVGTVDDSFVAETNGSRIVLAGQNDRGTLYSSYELLEKVGVKFFAPSFKYYEGNTEFVPTNSTLTISGLDGVSQPSFEFRRKYVEEGWSHSAENLPQLIDWMAKNKLNTLVVPYDYIAQGNTKWDDWRVTLISDLEKRGIIVEVGGHGFESFLTKPKYAATHPDWFVAGHNVFNIANDEAVNTYVSEVVEYLRARPEIGIFDAWPPDVASWPPAVLTKFGTSANAYAYVVNKLHAAVTQQLPGVRIEAIAYASHVDPPSQEYKYDESILIDFAPYFRSYRDTVFSSGNQSVINQINSWKNTFNGTFTMYEYYRRYAFHSLPIVLPQLIGQELPYYKTFGMEGIGTYSEPADWITFEITHYILAKLSWNADVNAQEVITDYIQSRYGAASVDMAEYFRLTEEAARSIYNSPTGDMNNTTRVTGMRNNYLQAKSTLESALSKVAAGKPEAYMIQRLLWNIDFSIADVSVDYYRLLGDNTNMVASRLQAQDALNAHRFDGIILQNSYLVREYISGYGNLDWVHDMYRGKLKYAPMLTTMGTHQSNTINHIVDGNEETVYWSNLNPAIGDYVGIDLQKVKHIKEINLLMSTTAKPNDYIRNGVIEGSKDFIEWKTIATISNQPVSNLTLEDNTEARFIRIRSTAAQTQWVIMREFDVVTEEIVVPNHKLQTTLEADRSEVKSGETVNIKAGLENIPVPIYALDVDLEYDPNVLEFVSAQSIKNGLSVIDTSTSLGKVRILAASEGVGNALEGNVQFLETSFKVKGIGESVTSLINLSKAVLADEHGVETEALPSTTSIQVNTEVIGISGDINNDGKVSIGDLAIVAAHYGKDTNSTDWQQVKKADVNKDGVINLEDLAIVAQKLIE